jgi:hypothetical protein
MQDSQVLCSRRLTIGVEILDLLEAAPRTVPELCQLLGEDRNAVKCAVGRLRKTMQAVVVGQQVSAHGGLPIKVWGAVGAAYMPGVRTQLATQYEADRAALVASRAQRSRDKCARYRERRRSKQQPAPTYRGELVGPPYAIGYRW